MTGESILSDLYDYFVHMLESNKMALREMLVDDCTWPGVQRFYQYKLITQAYVRVFFFLH